MKIVMGMALILGFASGCIIEDEPHHGGVAVVAEGHRHCAGCGHVYVRGAWYDER